MTEQRTNASPRTLLLPGTGIRVLKARFSPFAALSLRLLATVPPLVREKIFFNRYPVSFTLQKVLQRALGGPSLVCIEFTEGWLAGRRFECWMSEKYFLLGTAYEEAVRTRLERVVRPGDVVYDIGAHGARLSI